MKMECIMNAMHKAFRGRSSVFRLPVRSSSFLLALAIAACTSVIGARGGYAAPELLALGRQYTSWFYAGQTDRLWEIFSPDMKKLAGNIEGLKRFRTSVLQQRHETKVLTERTKPFRLGTAAYERIACLSSRSDPLRLQWVVEGDGTIIGFIAQSASEKVPAGFLGDQPKDPLRCP